MNVSQELFNRYSSKGMIMQAISDNLIHFLGKQFRNSPYEQLKIFDKIINEGLCFRKTNIIFGDGGSVDNYIICFTDIPLSLCDEHASKYGKFGIGLKKSSIKRCGGSPVRYFFNYLPIKPEGKSLIDNRGAMYTNLCAHFKFVTNLKDELDKDDNFAIYNQKGEEIYSHMRLNEWAKQQLTIFSFEKETGDLGPALDDTNNIDPFYKEREWRLVPLVGNLDAGSVIKEIGDNYFYKFNRNDVNLVVTPNDDIRNEVLRFFLRFETQTDERLKEFSTNPVPIITYDDLQKW